MKIKQGITEKDREILTLWGYSYFKDYIDKYNFTHIIKSEVNWDISLLLVDSDEEIYGMYLLGDNNLSNLGFNQYDGMVGLEGVLLLVDEDFRGQGYGDQLKNHPSTLGIDYIWGQQLKSLDNLNDWLKRRELVHETEYFYITSEIF